MKDTCNKCGGSGCGGTCSGFQMKAHLVMLFIAVSAVLVAFGAALTGGGF